MEVGARRMQTKYKLYEGAGFLRLFAAPGIAGGMSEPVYLQLQIYPISDGPITGRTQPHTGLKKPAFH